MDFLLIAFNYMNSKLGCPPLYSGEEMVSTYLVGSYAFGTGSLEVTTAYSLQGHSQFIANLKNILKRGPCFILL